MLGIVLLMVTWWVTEAIPIAVTSLLPLALYPTLSILPAKEVSPLYGHPIIFLFLSGFILAQAIEQVGIHRRVALLVLTKVGKKPIFLLLALMVTSAFFSMWISNTATTLLMFPMVISLIQALESYLPEDKVKPLTISLLLALAYSASIGGIGTLVGTPPNAIYAGMITQLAPGAPEPTFSWWIFRAFPISFVLLMVCWLYFIWMGKTFRKLKLPSETLEDLKAQRKALPPWSWKEKWVAFIFLMTALLWITRVPMRLGHLLLPGWSQWFHRADYLHDATVGMAMVVLLFIIRKKGSPLLTWREVEKGIPWGVLLLFGGGFALARGFQETGLADLAGKFLQGLSHLPLPLLFFIIFMTMCILTEFTSNTAITATLLPVLSTLPMGPKLPAILFGATIAASCAFILPVATPPNAIVFASQRITIKDMVRYGLILDLLASGFLTFYLLV